MRFATNRGLRLLELVLVMGALLLVWPIRAQAQIASDGSCAEITFTAASGSGNCTVSSNSNRLMVVGVESNGCTGGTNVTAITYNGVAMTQIDTQNSGFGTTATTFYLPAPTAGTNSLAVTTASVCTTRMMAVMLSGAKQSGQPDAHGTSIDSGFVVTSLTTTITTVAANSWAVLFGSDNAGSLTAGSGSTLRQNGLVEALFDSNGALTAGSQSMTFGFPNGNVAMGFMASFAPATGGGGGTCVPTLALLGVTSCG